MQQGILADSYAGVQNETQLRMPSGTNNVTDAPDQAAWSPLSECTIDWFGCLDSVAVNDQALLGQWSTVSNQRSIGLRFIIGAGGPTLRLWGSSTGSNSFSTPDAGVLPVSNGQYFGARGTRRNSDGLMKTYYSLSDPPEWVLLNSGVASAGAAIFNSTTVARIGSIGSSGGTSSIAVGYFRHGRVTDGFDGAGTELMNPDVRALVDTLSSFADAAGNTWTLRGTADLVSRPKP